MSQDEDGGEWTQVVSRKQRKQQPKLPSECLPGVEAFADYADYGVLRRIVDFARFVSRRTREIIKFHKALLPENSERFDLPPYGLEDLAKQRGCFQGRRAPKTDDDSYAPMALFGGIFRRLLSNGAEDILGGDIDLFILDTTGKQGYRGNICQSLLFSCYAPALRNAILEYCEKADAKIYGADARPPASVKTARDWADWVEEAYCPLQKQGYIGATRAYIDSYAVVGIKVPKSLFRPGCEGYIDVEFTADCNHQHDYKGFPMAMSHDALALLVIPERLTTARHYGRNVEDRPYHNSIAAQGAFVSARAMLDGAAMLASPNVFYAPGTMWTPTEHPLAAQLWARFADVYAPIQPPKNVNPSNWWKMRAYESCRVPAREDERYSGVPVPTADRYAYWAAQITPPTVSCYHVPMTYLIYKFGCRFIYNAAPAVELANVADDDVVVVADRIATSHTGRDVWRTTHAGLDGYDFNAASWGEFLNDIVDLASTIGERALKMRAAGLLPPVDMSIEMPLDDKSIAKSVLYLEAWKLLKRTVYSDADGSVSFDATWSADLERNLRKKTPLAWYAVSLRRLVEQQPSVYAKVVELVQQARDEDAAVAFSELRRIEGAQTKPPLADTVLELLSLANKTADAEAYTAEVQDYVRSLA
jgi:hypothetical protein